VKNDRKYKEPDPDKDRERKKRQQTARIRKLLMAAATKASVLAALERRDYEAAAKAAKVKLTRGDIARLERFEKKFSRQFNLARFIRCVRRCLGNRNFRTFAFIPNW